MRAHRRNGVGEYVPCRAKSVDACPYGARQHMEFKDDLALVQYNTIEGTGHDWDELRELYPSLFEHSTYYDDSLENVLEGSSVPMNGFDMAIEAIAAGDAVRSKRDVITRMDWSDPGATFRALWKEMEKRSIRAYAAGFGVNADDLPLELVEVDLRDACGAAGAGLTGRLVGDSLDRIHRFEEDEDHVVRIVGNAIAEDPGVARGVALAIGRAHGDLVPPEDAELPAESVRSFDEKVRAEAAKEYPDAAARYADTLRGVADALEDALKRNEGMSGYLVDGQVYLLHGGDDILQWRDIPDHRARIERTIRALRGTADEVRGNASLDMGDARNAAQAAVTLQNADRLVARARSQRGSMGRDGGRNDEVFRDAASRNELACRVLGSTIRRTQGLRGYYAEPVPGTASLATEDEAGCLEELSKVPQQYRAYGERPGEAAAFLQDYGLTALRPDGTMEPDFVRAIRRSVTRRLTTDKYEAMLGRSDHHVKIPIRNGVVADDVPCEAAFLSERLFRLPRMHGKFDGEPLGEEELSAVSTRAYILEAITAKLDS